MADPSDKARIERLRPNSVPEGLVALGTVVQVSNLQVKLQLTGGIICLVPRDNINQVYSNLLDNVRATHGQCEEPTPLTKLFNRGEQYICKVIEKRPRKGYADAQDIIATLDPTSIQEEALPKVLLSIPYVPLQGVVKSVEDHGYQLDIGFGQLCGFLSSKEAKGFCLGQVVRCVLKQSLDPDASRIAQLSISEESVKKSEFSREKVTQNTITDRCILPGSRSYLTVMKVSNQGLTANFMDQFAGFVTIDHLKDEWHVPKENYKISDQLNCTVLYFNQITNTFSLSLRKKSNLKTLDNYHVGQVISKAKVACVEARTIKFKIDNKVKAVANVRDAIDDDLNTLTKDEILTKLDSTFPDNSIHKCRVKSINLADDMLVVSLRQDFLELPYVSIEELKPADMIEVTVKKYVKDGIVVTFGHNLKAIILNCDLNNYISSNSYRSYPIGKKIVCRVLKLDMLKQPPRLYLTNKEQLMNKNLEVISSYEKSLKGKSTQAIVIKVAQNGLIVELFNNVKGFVPRRFISSVPIQDMQDAFKIGQVISCSVYRSDPSRKTLQLSIIDYKDVLKEKKRGKKEKKEKKEKKQTEKLDKLEKQVPVTRQKRSEDARLREEKLREAEKNLMDPNRPPQSIPDFERLILKTPNQAGVWIKYSNYFLENVETEKARIVCRRALRTISFRLEKEKLQVWLHLIKIEAKFGGSQKFKEVVEEAAQTTDQLKLYQGITKILTRCNQLSEAEEYHELLLKANRSKLEVWLNYIQFAMEQRKDLEKGRNLFEKACKILSTKSDLVTLKCRFAQLEMMFGEVERGKTMFELLISDNWRRADIRNMYEDLKNKYQH